VTSLPAAFSAELVGRRVVDMRGDLLGLVRELLIDTDSGGVLGLLLELDAGLDASLLPWPSHSGLLLVPTGEVERVDEDVHLNR
jgi:sporulation protein YlmC with PRC-barrel domain